MRAALTDLKPQICNVRLATRNRQLTGGLDPMSVAITSSCLAKGASLFAVDCLKALDANRPLREATLSPKLELSCDGR